MGQSHGEYKKVRAIEVNGSLPSASAKYDLIKYFSFNLRHFPTIFINNMKNKYSKQSMTAIK